MAEGNGYSVRGKEFGAKNKWEAMCGRLITLSMQSLKFWQVFGSSGIAVLELRSKGWNNVSVSYRKGKDEYMGEVEIPKGKAADRN